MRFTENKVVRNPILSDILADSKQEREPVADFQRSVLSETAGAGVPGLIERPAETGEDGYSGESRRYRFEPLHWRASHFAQSSGGQNFVVVLPERCVHRAFRTAGATGGLAANR